MHRRPWTYVTRKESKNSELVCDVTNIAGVSQPPGHSLQHMTAEKKKQILVSTLFSVQINKL